MLKSSGKIQAKEKLTEEVKTTHNPKKNHALHGRICHQPLKSGIKSATAMGASLFLRVLLLPLFATACLTWHQASSIPSNIFAPGSQGGTPYGFCRFISMNTEPVGVEICKINSKGPPCYFTASGPGFVDKANGTASTDFEVAFKPASCPTSRITPSLGTSPEKEWPLPLGRMCPGVVRMISESSAADAGDRNCLGVAVCAPDQFLQLSSPIGGSG